MKITGSVLLAILLTACAAPIKPQVDAMRSYVAQNKPAAMSGAIKWSAYYGGLYPRMVAASAPSSELQRCNELIRYAQQFESGRITEDEFAYQRRAAGIASQEASEAYAEGERKRRAATAAAMIASMPKFEPIPYRLTPPVVLTPPTSTAFPQQQVVSGVTAYFTGRQEPVQTVTYQSGWKCEYRYLGSTFARVFTGSCPGSVQVE